MVPASFSNALKLPQVKRGRLLVRPSALAKIGGAYQLEKIKMGAAGQNDDLLSKCSQRAFLPPFFFIISERDEEVVEERGGLCEMSYARREMPSRIGGDVCPTGTPLLWRP